MIPIVAQCMHRYPFSIVLNLQQPLLMPGTVHGSSPLPQSTSQHLDSNPARSQSVRLWWQASPGFRLYSQWSIRLELAHQAAAAVEFMHSHNVVHRDLTSNNLLVTDKWEAKVSALPVLCTHPQLLCHHQMMLWHHLGIMLCQC